MASTKLSPSLLFGTAVVAAAAFAALTRAVASGRTAGWDRRAQGAVHAIRGSGGTARALSAAARSTTPLGKWWGQLPAAFLTAAKLRKEQRNAAAWTIAGTSVAAAVLPVILDRITVQRLSPRARNGRQKQSYPSGHALQISAMAVSVGYVMRREKLSAPAWLTPLGPLSIATGLGRLVLDRHWSSDVAAGYCAGIALGAASSGVYELYREHE